MNCMQIIRISHCKTNGFGIQADDKGLQIPENPKTQCIGYILAASLGASKPPLFQNT